MTLIHKRVSGPGSRYDFPPFRAPYLLPDDDAFADYKLSPEQFHAKVPGRGTLQSSGRSRLRHGR